MKEYLVCKQYLALIGHAPIKIELWAKIIPLTEEMLALDWEIHVDGDVVIPPLGPPLRPDQAITWFLDYCRFHLCHLLKCFALQTEVESV